MPSFKSLNLLYDSINVVNRLIRHVLLKFSKIITFFAWKYIELHLLWVVSTECLNNLLCKILDIPQTCRISEQAFESHCTDGQYRWCRLSVTQASSLLELQLYLNWLKLIFNLCQFWCQCDQLHHPWNKKSTGKFPYERYRNNIIQLSNKSQVLKP